MSTEKTEYEARPGHDPGSDDPPLLPIRLIPIKSIRVTNPRVRDQKKFRQLVDSIARIGLKKPIRVAPRGEEDEDGPLYNLVYGQGRMEAFIELGETEIPAQVSDTDKETQLLMSLAENIVRRIPLRFEHIQHIVALKNRGYSAKQIAEKIDLSDKYIMAILHLWKHGEERLLSAVEKGTIPVSMAVEIARASDEDAQRILVEAYESNKLRGSKLIKTRRMLEIRRTHGKKMSPLPGRKKAPSTAEALVRAYQQEVQKQKILSKKARLSESRLIFIGSAMKQLLEDEHFITLLRAEKLDSMPRHLAERTGVQGIFKRPAGKDHNA